MDISCPSCRAALRIPDEKLPQAPRFAVKCPQCGGEIVVDRSSADLPPEAFPPGARTVLILTRNLAWDEAAGRFFREAGFHRGSAANGWEVAGRLRQGGYNVLVADDAPESAPALAEIASWSGLRRRELTLILITASGASFDPEAAFLRGANACLAAADAPRAGELLAQALQAREDYYRPVALAARP